MSKAKYGHTGIHGVQMPQNLVCRECGWPYVGHHLTKECEACRFVACAIEECGNTIKLKAAKKGQKYCSEQCRKQGTRPPAWNLGQRDTKVCARSGCDCAILKESCRKFCSPECRRLAGTQKTGATFTCRACGTVIYGKRGQAYCSDECHPNVYKCFNPDCSEIIRSRTNIPGKRKKFCSLVCRQVAGAQCACPSGEELSLAPTLTRFGYVHTGDSKFFRRWPDGSVKNPDYVNFKERKVFEYFGSYWHRNDIGREPYIQAQWAAIGYTCTVLWDADLQSFLDDPDPFLNR